MVTRDDVQNKRAIDNIQRRIRAVDPNDPRAIELMHRIGMVLAAQIKINIRTPQAGRSHGLIDTGALLNSIRYEIHENSVEVGSYGVRYAKVHEFGTVGAGGTLPDIRAKNAKNLTIPLEPEYRRVTARQIFANLEYFRSKSGNEFLKDIRNGKLAYLLRESVAIPPRPFIRPAIEKQTPNILQMIREVIRK